MILVTGGTGLVGSHLLMYLVKKGYRVRALKRKTSKMQNVIQTFSYYTDNPEEAFSKIEWVEGNLWDYDSVVELLAGIDKVYHAAAFVSFDPCDKKEIIDVNVECTANIINAAIAAGIRKLCFVSSTAAIGRPARGRKADENSLWKSSKGNTAYGMSKFRSEMEVWRGMEEGLPSVIVNPSIIIGPGNWHRSSSKMFNAMWKGMKFYTNGVTGYVDVRDVVHCMVQLMESDISGERFILSEGNYSYKKIFDTIAKALGKKEPTIHAGKRLTALAWRADWLKHCITRKPRLITKEIAASSHYMIEFSNEKVAKKLGYTYTPIEESIQWTAECYLKDRI